MWNGQVVLGKPKFAFCETLYEPCEFDYWHKNQSVGAGQSAKVIGLMETLPPYENSQTLFTDKTVGTNMKKVYSLAIG